VSSEQIAIELPSELLNILEELVDAGEASLDEIVKRFCVDGLFSLALHSQKRGQFYFDHINTLRQMKFPGIQDIPLPKK